MAKKLKYEQNDDIQELLATLKFHPAILEIRFASIYDELFKFYGGDMTDNIIDSFCKLFHCDERIITALINNKHRIQLNKVYNLVQYRREMLVMGLAWGYDKQFIAKHFFGNAQNVVYRGSYVSLTFLNSAWIENLKYTVYVLNDENSIEQVKNLLLNLDAFVTVLGR